MRCEMRLSVVMPALQEAAGISSTLQRLASWRAQGHEVIVVDGGSSDGTAEQAAAGADRVLAGPRGRARQMNAGAAVAQGQVLLFLHADTQLPENAAGLIQQALGPDRVWGRFDVHIEGNSPMLRVVATLMNWRSRWSGIATGDQAIFVRTDVFRQLGGYADQPLMEDIELSRRLLAFAKPVCLRQRVLTSGRRWQTRGVWRTIFLMWRLRWRYWRGESPESLARAYR
jgi:rSAM/selenodomain-associated transferase 2